MKRRFWLVVAALTLITAGIILQFRPAESALVAPPDPNVRAVQIQHEFVRIPVQGVVGAERPLERRAESEPAPMVESSRTLVEAFEAATRVEKPEAPSEILRVSHAVPTAAKRANSPGRSTAQDIDRERSLLEKARRAFVGDGRYRPQPFPRVKDN